VSCHLVKDWAKSQTAIMEPEIVQIKPVLLPEVMMLDGRALYERVRDGPFLGPPATEHESADGTTKSRH
jgi:hypothetical protein